MDNLTRIRIRNILHEMEAAIRNDSAVGKEQALELMAALDHFWDEIKGDNEIEAKWKRAAKCWSTLPQLTDYTRRLHEQLF